MKSPSSKATIVAAEPQLFVTDIKRSCEFFCEKLGFSLVFRYGKPPYYAQVARDAAHLNLRCVEQPVIESTIRAEVAFHQKLKKQPWGARNFVVKDPDGNLLLFAGPAN